MPELRIVDDGLWQAVKTRYAGVQKKWNAAEPRKRFNQFVRPKYFFTGMTKCGECGLGFVVYYRDQLGCFGTRDRGTCTNKLTISRLEVEARVLSALQDKLMRKDFFEEFCREFAKETNRQRMEQRASLNGAKRELERVNREIRKVIEAIKAGFPLAELKPEMDSLRRARNNSWRSSRPQTSPHRFCTRAWPTSIAPRSRNSPLRSSATTRVWKPQTCCAGSSSRSS